ncbi:MAG TPA: hypothetical protein VGL65_05430 [Gemmatimonadales bacterium]|jgi:hypothetical protein
MRCLGRLLLLAFIAIVALAAWLFRSDLRRWINQRARPGSTAVETGRPSAAGVANATARLDRMERERLDSVTISAAEMASLLANGVHFLPGASRDSLSLELGDGELRMRTVIDSAAIPGPWRKLMAMKFGRYATVVARGPVAPVRAGLGEFSIDHLSIDGVPLPADVVSRLIAAVTGRAGERRVEFALPPQVGGFRVHHDGVIVYREGAER